MEDVGLKARIWGVTEYQRAAKQIEQSNRGLGVQMQQTAAQAQKSSGSILSSLKPLIAMAVTGIAIKVGVDFMRGAIQQASDLNEALNKTDVVFGAMTEDVKTFAKAAAQNLGLSNAEALDAAGSFGAMFVSMGIGNKESATMSKNLLQLAADLGSLYNVDPTDMLMRLRSGMVGEAEPMRRVGVLLDEQNVKLEATRLGLAENVDELTQAQKVQARYSLILRQSTVAQGDFARTSTGFANATRILQGVWKDVTAEIGTKFLPIVAPLVVQLGQALPGAAKAVLPFIQGMVENFQRLTAVLGLVGGALRAGDIAQAFRTVAVVFQDWVWPAVQGMVGQLASGIGSAWSWVSDQAPEWGKQLLKWGGQFADWVPGAFSDLTSALGEKIGKAWDWIKQETPKWADNLEKWSKAFADWAGGVWKAIEPELKAMLDKARTWVETNAPVWREAFSGFVDQGKKIAGELVDNMGKELEARTPELRQQFEDAGRAASKGFLQGLGRLYKETADLMRDSATAGTQAEIDEFQRRTVAVLDAILTPFRMVESFVWGIFQGIADVAVEALRSRMAAEVAAVTAQTEKALLGPRPMPRLPVAAVIPQVEAGETAGREMGEDVKRGLEETAPAVEDVWKKFAPDKNTWEDSVDDVIRVTQDNIKKVAVESERAGAALVGGVGGGAKQASKEAKAAIADLEWGVKQLELAARQAEAALRGLSAPRFAGMEEMEDAIFGAEQQVLKLKLAELLAGEEGKKAAEKVAQAAKSTGAVFDTLAAQQAEMTQGIPVPLQRARWEAEQARAAAQRVALATTDVSRAAAKEKSPFEVAREQGEKALEILRLQYQLRYNEMTRQAEKVYKTETEGQEKVFATVQEYLAALKDAVAQKERTTQELEMEKELLEEAKRVLTDQGDVVGFIRMNREATVLAEQEILEAQREQLDILKQAERIAAAAAAAPPIPDVPAPQVPGLQTGGKVLGAGAAWVGERGRELAFLPTGATVLPAAASRPAQVSRSYSDTFNVYDAHRAVDVVGAIRRWQAFQRITQGR